MRLTAPRPPTITHSGEASSAGPCARTRSFFFLSFERLDVTAHNFVTIDPEVAGVLRASGFPVELGNVPYDVQTTSGMGKLDHHFSSDHSLTLRGAASNTLNENIEPFGGIIARSRGAVQRRKDWSLAASHIAVLSTSWVNEARFQYAYQDLQVDSLDPNCGGPCEGNFDGGPTLELPGIASVGRQRFMPNPRRYGRFQLMDTASFFTGRHAAKAGVEFNYIDNSVFSLPLHFGGRYIFSALAPNPAIGLNEPISAVEALRRGLPATYIQGYGDSNGPYTYKDLSLFVQDEWRIGTRLTVKPGLRYQKQFWQQFQSDVSNVGGTRLQYTLPPDNNNVASRLAVAFDPARRRQDVDSRVARHLLRQPHDRHRGRRHCHRRTRSRARAWRRPPGVERRLARARPPAPRTDHARTRPRCCRSIRGSRVRTRTTRRSASIASWARTSRSRRTW